MKNYLKRLFTHKMAAAARILVNMHEVKTLKGQNGY